MKNIVKFFCVFLLCISKINSADTTCPTGDEVLKTSCPSTCTFNQKTAASCSSASKEACKTITVENTCKADADCTWTEAKGSCAAKNDAGGSGTNSGSGTSSGTGTTNNNTDTNGASSLKNFLFSLLVSLLF